LAGQFRLAEYSALVIVALALAARRRPHPEAIG
jgi:hypothetical protein